MKQLWIAAALAVLVSGYTALAADAVVPSLGKWTLPADTTQVAGEVSVRGTNGASKISAFYQDQGFKNGHYYLLVRQNQVAFAYAALAVIPQERAVTPRYDRTRSVYRPVQKERGAYYQVPEQKDLLAEARNRGVYHRDAKNDRLQRHAMTRQRTGTAKSFPRFRTALKPSNSCRPKAIESTRRHGRPVKWKRAFFTARSPMPNF